MKTLIIALLHIPFLINAQSSDVFFKIAGDWNVGDSIRYHIVNTHYEKFNDQVMQSDTMHNDAVLKLIAANDSSYTFKWHSYNGRTNNPEYQSFLEIEEFMKVPLIYRTDFDGKFKEIQNWEAFRDNYLIVMQKYVHKMAEENGIDTSITEVAFAMEVKFEEFRKSLSTREAIEKMALHEIKYYHWPYGKSFYFDSVYTFEDRALQDGMEFPCNSRVKFKNSDSNANSLELVVITDYSKKAMEMIKRKAFEEMDDKDDMADKMESIDSEMNERYFFDFDKESLRIQKLIHEKETTTRTNSFTKISIQKSRLERY